jgi:hypothetical protein
VENISYDAVVGMLVLDFVLYSVIGWYLDKVLHSEHGGRQPFYFMCTSTFWSGKHKHHYPPCREPHPELSACVEHVPYELRSQVNDKRYERSDDGTLCFVGLRWSDHFGSRSADVLRSQGCQSRLAEAASARSRLTTCTWSCMRIRYDDRPAAVPYLSSSCSELMMS